MFPWGGKLTAESIKFFSPLVMWTRFSSSQEKHNALFSAFLEYYQVYSELVCCCWLKAKVLTVKHVSLTIKAWLEMTIQVKEEKEPSQVRANREAQHKYLTWRAQKVIYFLFKQTFVFCIVVTVDLCLVVGRILDMVFLENYLVKKRQRYNIEWFHLLSL